ncbi:12831_t:CDS:1 [Ambispora gerdemannii]|uniref:12831_t:CDS:1 n=1 Tax=Ambispora gerdemannii TaxID=144530 RepID=A0A9N8VGA0_9GLOM|nr:12831_t:CDS:1 [Ambispora gerdemannii]
MSHEPYTFISQETPLVEQAEHVFGQAAEQISSQVESAKETTRSLFTTVKETFSPVTGWISWIQDKFPPLAWFIYAAVILNAIPIAIFLGFLAATTLTVFSIAGGGILVVEGFFFLLGCGVVLPVIGFAVFAAFIAFAFVLLTYGGWKLFRTVIRIFGFTYQEAKFDITGAAAGFKRGLSRSREEGETSYGNHGARHR